MPPVESELECPSSSNVKTFHNDQTLISVRLEPCLEAFCLLNAQPHPVFFKEDDVLKTLCSAPSKMSKSIEMKYQHLVKTQKHYVSNIPKV